MTVTREYAEYSADLTYDDLRPGTVAYAKHLLLDGVGLAIGCGSRAESTDSLSDAVKSLDPDGSGATVLSTGTERSPASAALLNGAVIHSLDYDDTHRGGSIHPGASVVSAGLAAAEQANASGKAFLTAVVAGYEIVCRLGEAVNPPSSYARGFHMTGTCGVFGAAATATKLLGGDADEIAAALGVNGSQAAGSLQFLENGGWNKRLHPGWAAHGGIVAAELARHGFRAADAAVEGDRGFLHSYSDDPQPKLATAGLGETYELENVAIKPYPVCRYIHGSLDAIRDFTAYGLDPTDIKSIAVEIPTTGYDIVGEPTNTYPQSLVDGQFNIRYCVALALARSDPSVDDFVEGVEDGVDDEVRRLIDLTDVGTAEWIDQAYPQKWISTVAVETDAKTHKRTVEFPRGEPENPLSWEELVGKFDDLVEPILGARAATRVREAVADVESRSVRDLTAPVVKAAGGNQQPATSD